jgi:sialic acid synthase SpsE
MGSSRRDVLPCEREVRHVSRGSVVSLCEIAAGTVITPAMLCVKRPGGGIEPARLNDLVGTVAVRPIAADTMIDWTMVQPAESLETTIAEHDSMAW